MIRRILSKRTKWTKKIKITYIGNSQLSNKHMSCYKCDTSLSESTKTISALGYSSTPIDDYAKIGDGYASITLIKHILD